MPRVLIVDDEPSIRFALRRWFERQGWAADEATNGAEALDLILCPAEGADSDYALIVCDLRMPVMSGIELHARLLAERPRLVDCLLFTTGHDAADPAVFPVPGFQSRVLQKPFDFQNLRALVESIAGPM